MKDRGVGISSTDMRHPATLLRVGSSMQRPCAVRLGSGPDRPRFRSLLARQPDRLEVRNHCKVFTTEEGALLVTAGTLTLQSMGQRQTPFRVLATEHCATS